MERSAALGETTQQVGGTSTGDECFVGHINFALQSVALLYKVVVMKPTEAEEHLRVIRSLMEKATIYRAISAPTAFVGGLASLLFGGSLFFRWRPLPSGHEEHLFEWAFVGGWPP
jgi:hypothetical protein